MFTYRPPLSAERGALIHSQYVREQILVWETLWPEAWLSPPRHVKNSPSTQLYAIFDFHCLSERVTSWHQIAKCLLYISSESQGESCLRCQREGFLGKQFIYSGFLDFSRYMQCHSLGGSSVSKDCPLYLCVIASWGVGIGLWLSEQELFGTLSYDSHTLWERGGCEHTTSIIVKKNKTIFADLQ